MLVLALTVVAISCEKEDSIKDNDKEKTYKIKISSSKGHPMYFLINNKRTDIISPYEEEFSATEDLIITVCQTNNLNRKSIRLSIYLDGSLVKTANNGTFGSPPTYEMCLGAEYRL